MQTQLGPLSIVKPCFFFFLFPLFAASESLLARVCSCPRRKALSRGPRCSMKVWPGVFVSGESCQQPSKSDLGSKDSFIMAFLLLSPALQQPGGHHNGPLAWSILCLPRRSLRRIEKLLFFSPAWTSSVGRSEGSSLNLSRVSINGSPGRARQCTKNAG